MPYPRAHPLPDGRHLAGRGSDPEAELLTRPPPLGDRSNTGGALRLAAPAGCAAPVASDPPKGMSYVLTRLAKLYDCSRK